MRSIFTGVHARMSGLAVAMTAMSAVVGVARGDQILEIWNDSLTTYLPAAASSVQDAWPLHQQRGVNIDGSRRTWTALGWSVAGNPTNAGGAESWNGNLYMGDMRVDIGAYSPTDVDLSLPSNGFRWIIGRTYNGVQDNAGHRDSDGPQGLNWWQLSQGELYYKDRGSGGVGSTDAVYILYGADRYIEFKWASTSLNDANTRKDEFRAVNGAAGVMQLVQDKNYNPVGPSGDPDLWTYTDQHGNKTVFFGGNTPSNRADWQIWKMTDPAGNVCYVGDASTSTTAVSSGYNADGSIAVAYDAATTAGGGGHRFTYTYTTIDSVSRLTRVKAEIKAGGSWASPSSPSTVGQVDYAYYQTGDNTDGNNGNLKLVTITTPLTDSGVSLVKKKLYRYYVGAYNGSTNPGNPNSIKMVVGFEGYRSYDWDTGGNLNDDPQSASTANLKGYADAYFEYPSGDYRISKAFFNGECGCSGGNNGLYEFTYDLTDKTGSTHATLIANGAYDTDRATRTIIKRPDVTYETRYFDETGQPLGTLITDLAPTAAYTLMWGTDIVRNSDGQITELRTPANITTYTHNTGGKFDGALTASSSVGLIHQWTRLASTDLKGFTEYRKHKNAGTGGSAYYDGMTAYETSSPPSMTIGSAVLVRPVTVTSEVYETEATSVPAALQTLTAFTAHSSAGALMLKSTTRSNPLVTTAQNGSNSATTTKQYLRADGTSAFAVSASTIYTYSQYTNGLLVKRIDDAQTNHGSDYAGGDDPNGTFGVSETGSGIRNITTYAYDDQGRMDTSTHPDGHITKMYYSKLADGRMVTISCPLFDTPDYYGPMTYVVTNQAGRAEVQATVGISSAGITTALTGWIDESDADPITALDIGSLVRLTVNIMNNAGTREEAVRAYHTIPGSGAGSSGTNYDATTFGFDDMGRRWRVKQASGTITRSVYDTLGRSIESWIGTNDYSFSGGGGQRPRHHDQDGDHRVRWLGGIPEGEQLRHQAHGRRGWGLDGQRRPAGHQLHQRCPWAGDPDRQSPGTAYPEQVRQPEPRDRHCPVQRHHWPERHQRSDLGRDRRQRQHRSPRTQ